MRVTEKDFLTSYSSRWPSVPFTAFVVRLRDGMLVFFSNVAPVEHTVRIGPEGVGYRSADGDGTDYRETMSEIVEDGANIHCISWTEGVEPRNLPEIQRDSNRL